MAAGSKSLTSAAMRTGYSLASNALMKSMPLRPATAASQVDRQSLPSGVTAPSPVTATLRIGPRAYRRFRNPKDGYTMERTAAETIAARFRT